MQTLAELVYDPVVTVAPETSAEAALEHLLTAGATELYVVDAEHALLGIVPDYELLKARLHGPWNDLSARQLMSQRILTFSPTTSLAEAMKLFREGQNSRAAIVEDGKLLGQITRSTLLKSLFRQASQSAPRPKFLRSEFQRNATMLRALQFG